MKKNKQAATLENIFKIAEIRQLKHPKIGMDGCDFAIFDKAEEHKHSCFEVVTVSHHRFSKARQKFVSASYDFAHQSGLDDSLVRVNWLPNARHLKIRFSPTSLELIQQ